MIVAIRNFKYSKKKLNFKQNFRRKPYVSPYPTNWCFRQDRSINKAGWLSLEFMRDAYLRKLISKEKIVGRDIKRQPSHD